MAGPRTGVEFVQLPVARLEVQVQSCMFEVPAPRVRSAAGRRSFRRPLTLLSVSLLLVTALLAASLGGLTGCSRDPAPSGPRAALAEGRRLWTSAGPSAYDLRVKRTCFCDPALLQSLDMHVVNGQVQAVWHDPGHEVRQLALGVTVDELFDRIEGALDAGFETVDVQYDPRFGYPAEVHLDKADLVDDTFMATTLLLCRSSVADTLPTCDCAADSLIRYHFTAVDSNEIVIVTGCLGLDFKPSPSLSEPESITGTRCLRPSCVLDVPPAFPGEYGVGGNVNQFGQIFLDLNQNWADFNIGLTGRFDQPGGDHGNFSGQWTYSSFVGPQAGGHFNAVRMP